MIEQVLIYNNKDNDDFHSWKKFGFLVFNNQGKFYTKEKIAQHFFANYIKEISINLIL